MKTKTLYLKVRKPNQQKEWFKIKSNYEDKALNGISLRTGRKEPIKPCDVISFYEGELKELEGLGMPYIPTADVCTILDTIVPDSMAFETHIACRIVQEKVKKPLSEFVAEKLKYTELELCKALSAEQVDAVALAIYNVEYKSQAMIIGDQTGIGKGRVAAAMIRYAVKNNILPIFLSEKPNLFSDIYRDLSDIGSSDLVPFIINGKESKTDIKDAEGKVVHQAMTKPEQEKVFKEGKLPKNFDFAVATYTQFSSPKDRPTKAQFLHNIAAGSLIIMDEAHNASGLSNTGMFLQEVIKSSKGVVFLSATFAKRPDNMPIYAMKTAISDVNMTSEELIEAITLGGVALQEILASQLVSEGQMIRRERSFEGIEVNYIVLTEKELEHKSIFDNIVSVLRDVILFQEKYIRKIVDGLDKEKAGEGAEATLREGTDKAGVDAQPYFSKVFNVINQILFSLKAPSVALAAIEVMKEGKKPIIAFSSTMESFVDDMGVSAGDTIPIDFNLVLQKALDGIMRYTITEADGTKTFSYFVIAELDEEAQAFYHEIQDKINKISTGISISPIDVIKSIIRKAGFTCEEVTGRKYEMQLIENRNGNAAVLLNRKKVNTNDAFRMYNNNEVDCLLINQSGSTGASAHAVPTKIVPANEVKQRVMLVLQPELDISREVQKRGRINRTGQILKPRYDYITSCIPAEKRLMMMLRKKLKSLDANTTSNQKQSENVLNVDDFLNKYGDMIVKEYLVENPDINKVLGDPLNMEKDDSSSSNVTPENAAHKVSGRVAILNTEEQEKFYTEILDRYNNLEEYLKQTGRYDLELEALNLEAKTISEEVVIQGKSGTSVFSEDTILEHCEVNALKKPFKQSEIENIINKNLDNRNAEEIKDEIVADCKNYYLSRTHKELEENNFHFEKAIANITKEKGYDKAFDRIAYVSTRETELLESKDFAEDRIKTKNNNTFKYINSILSFYYIGRAIKYVTFFKEEINALCLGVYVNPKKANPYAPSSIKISIAIANSEKQLDLALSGEQGNVLNTLRGNSYSLMFHHDKEFVDTWDDECKNFTANRRKAHIVTGNILQGFSKYSTGKLISFTTFDGEIKKGILLPEDYNPSTEKDAGMVNVPIKNAKKLIESMQEGSMVYSSDKKLSISKLKGDGYYFIVPATSNYSKYFKDKNLISLCNNNRDGFEKRSNTMVATFSDNNIIKAIDILNNEYSVSVRVSKGVFEANKEEVDTKHYSQHELIKKRAIEKYNIDKTNFEQRRNPTSTIKVDMKDKRIRIAKAKAIAKIKILNLLK